MFIRLHNFSMNELLKGRMATKTGSVTLNVNSKTLKPYLCCLIN